MNKMITIGRLTRDPKLKYSQAGKAYMKLNVAVDRLFPWRNGGSEMTFRTNKKDRKLFAQAMGLEVFEDKLEKTDGWDKEEEFTELKITPFMEVGMIRGKWAFCGKGYEWCLQEFCKRNEMLISRFDYRSGSRVFVCIFTEYITGWYSAKGSGQSIGEAFFRAVVEFERGKK